MSLVQIITTPLRRKIIFIFFTAILVRVAYHYLTGFIYDDAFITFRYAENIAAGNGFVYNIGQRVLGTTTPLFTLMLSALVMMGVSVISGAYIISYISCGLTAVILYLFARSLGYCQLSFVPVLLYILFPRLLPTDTGGMETAFFTLLVTAAFHFQYKRFTLVAVVLAALSSVTRPEGLLVLAILMVYNIFKDHKRWVTYIIFPALIILPWILFAFYYFGSPIPNSVDAKLALYSRFGTKSLWENIILLMGWHSYFGIPLLGLAFAGGWWLKKKHDYGILEIVWLSGMVCSLALSSTALFLWYISPIYPLYILFAAAALPFMSERIELLRRNIRRVSWLIYLITMVVLIFPNVKSVQYYRTFQNNLENIHYAIGMYLRTHTKEGDIVAAEDIGYMGYYSGLTIIDRDGLISPEVVPYNRSGNYLGVILDFQPDWVVAAPIAAQSTFVDSSLFLERYQLEKIFRYTSESGYRLYFRVD